MLKHKIVTPLTCDMANHLSNFQPTLFPYTRMLQDICHTNLSTRSCKLLSDKLSAHLTIYLKTITFLVNFILLLKLISINALATDTDKVREAGKTMGMRESSSYPLLKQVKGFFNII